MHSNDLAQIVALVLIAGLGVIALAVRKPTVDDLILRFLARKGGSASLNEIAASIHPRRTLLVRAAVEESIETLASGGLVTAGKGSQSILLTERGLLRAHRLTRWADVARLRINLW